MVVLFTACNKISDEKIFDELVKTYSEDRSITAKLSLDEFQIPEEADTGFIRKILQKFSDAKISYDGKNSNLLLELLDSPTSESVSKTVFLQGIDKGGFSIYTDLFAFWIKKDAVELDYEIDKEKVITDFSNLLKEEEIFEIKEEEGFYILKSNTDKIKKAVKKHTEIKDDNNFYSDIELKVKDKEFTLEEVKFDIKTEKEKVKLSLSEFEKSDQSIDSPKAAENSVEVNVNLNDFLNGESFEQ